MIGRLVHKFIKPDVVTNVYFGDEDVKGTHRVETSITTSGYRVLHQLVRYIPWCDFSAIYTYTESTCVKFRFISYDGTIVDVIFHQVGRSYTNGCNMKFNIDGYYTHSIDDASVTLGNLLD